MTTEYQQMPQMTEKSFTSSKFGGRVIDVAKSKVECIDLADLLCGPGQMRKSGATWIARCPLPDHQDNYPSFAVYPDSWYCFGCSRGGDVVDLAALAWGYREDQMAGAAAELLHAFGHSDAIPKRPASWYRKQDRQRDTRAALEQTRKNIIRRRLFKHCVLPMLEPIDDPDEYAKEARRAWRDLKEMLP